MKDGKSGRFIGARIKQRRRELGLSQEKLAEALDVSYQQVQRYENGTNLLNTDKLQLIADFLDVTVGYFFEDIEFRAAEGADKYLPADEAKYLRFLKRLTKRDKDFVLRFMHLAAGKE